MRYGDKCLDHYKVNKFYKVWKSLSISVCNLKQVCLLFFLSTLKVHRFLLNLLTKFHLILLFNIFDIAFFIDLVLDFAYNYCHLVSYNVFILRTCHLASLILLDIELIFHLPCFIISDFIENSLVLTQIIKAFIDLHEIFCKSRLGYENICYKFLPYFEIVTISDILFPNRENFSDSIAFKELDICDDIEESGFMHPIWKSHNLCRKQIFSAFSFKLLFHTFRVHFYNTMSWNGIVFIISWFFLILIAVNDFQVVRSKDFSINFLNAIDEFYRSCVTILCEEWYSYISCFYRFQNVTHGLVYKQSILNFTLRLLATLSIKPFNYLTIVGLWIRWFLLVLVNAFLVIGFE